jgi:Activator of Hsp90 ATPase homolog 1-like protein
MAEFDWTTFTVRIPVKASLEKLYWCWSARAGLEYWFLRRSEFKSATGVLRKDNEAVQKGDDYTWLWHGWGDDTAEHGTILDCNGKDSITFSFGKAGNCLVTIKTEQDQNLVELKQVNIPDDEQGKQNWYLGCKTGWTFYLANLKSLLEGGVDLRNRDVAMKNVVNA